MRFINIILLLIVTTAANCQVLRLNNIQSQIDDTNTELDKTTKSYTRAEVKTTIFNEGDIIQIDGYNYICVNTIPTGLTVNDYTYIQTGNTIPARYMRPLIENTLDIVQIGASYGDLSIGNTFSESKALRILNRDILLLAIDYCKVFSYSLTVSSALEIWDTEDNIRGDSRALIEVSEGEGLTLKGNGSTSKIKVFPKHPTHVWNDFDFISSEPLGADKYRIRVDGIIIEGRDYFSVLETYPVIVNATTSGSGVDANIYIPPTVNLRPGFWDDLEIGMIIALEECVYCFIGQTDYFTLSGFSEANRTLTWSTDPADIYLNTDQGGNVEDDIFWPLQTEIGTKLGESLDAGEVLNTGELPASLSNEVHFTGSERNDYPGTGEEFGAALIGLAFPENTSDSDIETYGAFWSDYLNQDDAFIIQSNSFETNAADVQITNTVITNFMLAIGGRLGDSDIIIKDTYFTRNILGMQIGTNPLPDPNPLGVQKNVSITLDNCKADKMVFKQEGGYKESNRNSVRDKTKPFQHYQGEFCYNSPSTRHNWKNTKISEVVRFSSQQRSASLSPNVALDKNQISYFNNMQFNTLRDVPIAYRGGDVITSASAPAVFTDCVFDSCGISVSSEVTVSKCLFQNGSVGQFGLNRPTQVYGYNDDNYTFDVTNSYFIDSYVDAGNGSDHTSLIKLFLNNLTFEETENGFVSAESGRVPISFASSNAYVSNISYDLLDSRTSDNSFGLSNNNFIFIPLDNLVNTERNFSDNSSATSFVNSKKYNVVIKDISLIYPNSQELFDYNAFYINGNIGLVDYSILIDNINTQGGFVFGSKKVFKHNADLYNIKFKRLGATNYYRLKNLLGGLVSATVDGNNDLNFDAASGSGVYLDATTLRSINLLGQNSAGVLNIPIENYDGEFVIVPKSDITLTPYSSTIASNIVSDITTLEEGKRYVFKHIYKGEGFLTSALLTKQSKTITLVSSADGTQRTWNHFNEPFDNEPDVSNWILESAVLNIGGTTYKVNSDGKVIDPSGSIKGSFSNYNDMYTLYFRDAPTATTTITLTYDYYSTVDHVNYWILIR